MLDYRETPYAVKCWTRKTDALRNNRYRETLRFLPDDLGKCLEIGEENPFTPALRKRSTSITNTAFDLDYAFQRENAQMYSDDFDSVCVFEIVEHLMNPLSFLEWCADRIRSKENSRIYLSTPINKPKFMKASNHFHEFTRDELYWLFKRAGLSICREKTVNPIPFSWVFRGVRSCLRYIHFNRTIVFELKIDLELSSSQKS